jgi:predicted alpha/beta hydrolase
MAQGQRAVAQVFTVGKALPAVEPQAMTFRCADGVVLSGHLWSRPGASAVVIVNSATGVLARYYHRYAGFLAEHGFDVITYDYRGIGESRPQHLRRCDFRWSDWGTKDFAAVFEAAERLAEGRPTMVVGHSIGGFLPGLASGFERCSAFLSVGGQYAYYRDYAPESRFTNFLKWHVVMPALTAVCGYFPGRRLGWLEDLPAGVAFEWAFRGARVEDSFPKAQRQELVARLAAFRGPLLAVSPTDDVYATLPAIRRALAYYSGADQRILLISPSDLGAERIGHFDLFHSKHRDGFWRATLDWLVSGGRATHVMRGFATDVRVSADGDARTSTQLI